MTKRTSSATVLLATFAALPILMMAGGSASASQMAGSNNHPQRLTIHRHRSLPRSGALAGAPIDIPLDEGLSVRTPFHVVETSSGERVVRLPHYQGPDGTYDTPADLIQAINGVPCGDECTARALQRWGYAPDF